ncbi:metal ABC transporter solute-binding protein, Zn/Mn family [Flexivirga aerilata]|uniref:metal ABC transporter solute-binding protein, Zn/Mn family n=1 Tax=Flexivirga aerilata TaxID=1656889 RepID=UPI001BB2B920|nr:zinc ABC transporter substrate-binding protein [Flexivirga aerilata]
MSVVIGLTGCGASGGGAAGAGGGGDTIDVVASTNVYGSVAQQVGGDRVRVTSILSDPNVDPHGYDSSAKTAVDVAKAKLVVDNGLGYDDFMQDLLKGAPGGDRSVVTAATVLGVTGKDANPHLWYDTAQMPKVANAIRDALSKIDPKHSSDYAAGAKAFAQGMKPVDDTVRTMRDEFAGTKVAYTERVAGYLIDEAGLKLGIPAGFTTAVEEGDDPSPADTVAFDKALTTRTVKALLYNGQVTDKQTDQLRSLATKSGVPVVAVTETMPTDARDYQSWQLGQAKALLAALKGSK